MIQGKMPVPALVGIVPRRPLWPLIQRERWYHIPAAAAPRTTPRLRYLGFYFPKDFGPELRHKVVYGAPVRGVATVKRLALFPKETSHSRAGEDYHRLDLGPIERLPRPIPSRRLRRIVHIPTTREKIFAAREINDLYETSPIEDALYRHLQRRLVPAERQYCVTEGASAYFLDFAIFCREGRIDVECDGERYHTLPDALARDRARNNELTSRGWAVLRFSGGQILRRPEECLEWIGRTIRVLGGVEKGGERRG